MNTSLQDSIKNLGTKMLMAGQQLDAAGFPDPSWSIDQLTTDLKIVDRLKRDWTQIQAIVVENSESFTHVHSVSNMDGIIHGLNQRCHVVMDILRERIKTSKSFKVNFASSANATKHARIG